jgi:enamine deaminase RidA (YjgF/YER057c/UK114 family)
MQRRRSRMATPRPRPSAYSPRSRAYSKGSGWAWANVVKMQVFLVDNAGSPMDFKAFMEGYTQFFGGSQPNLPARSAIGVAALANPGFLVEIEVIAVKVKN